MQRPFLIESPFAKIVVTSTEYLIPFKFRLPLIFSPRGAQKLKGANLKPLKLRGCEIKRERIWAFCIEMFVSLKRGEN